MILSAASAIYGRAAAWRRQWYARDPSRRRRLSRPVVSIGNLRAGGTGKTPVVAHVSRLLLARGERPAILSRGYARRAPAEGVTVVSDGRSVLEPVERAGDEPLMLAQQLSDVPVLVGADRYLSGRFAEERLGTTIHILDDGFQHLALARDVDLLIAGESDLTDRVLPAGRLREQRGAAAAADALLVNDDGVETTERLMRELSVNVAFHIRRELGRPRRLTASLDVARDALTLRHAQGHPELGRGVSASQRAEHAELAEKERSSADSASSAVIELDAPVFAFAGISRPERFFSDLARVGWRVAGTMSFPDHHQFSVGDLDRIARAAHGASTGLVLTTEKDAVRLPGHDLRGLTIAAIPLVVTIEPPTFADWLITRIRAETSSAPTTSPVGAELASAPRPQQ